MATRLAFLVQLLRENSYNKNSEPRDCFTRVKPSLEINGQKLPRGHFLTLSTPSKILLNKQDTAIAMM